MRSSPPENLNHTVEKIVNREIESFCFLVRAECQCAARCITFPGVSCLICFGYRRERESEEIAPKRKRGAVSREIWSTLGGLFRSRNIIVQYLTLLNSTFKSSKLILEYLMVPYILLTERTMDTMAELGRTMEGHTGTVFSVCVSADGSRLFSGSTDSKIKVWDVATGACVQTLEGHTYGVISMCVSADGSRLFSGSYDNTIKVWNISVPSSSSSSCR